MKKLFLCFGLFIFSLLSIFAQEKACNCGDILEQLGEKINKNYIGLKLADASVQEAFKARLFEIKKQIKGVPEADCTPVLQDLLRFFGDGHLFVSQYPKPDQSTIEAHQDRIQQQKFDLQNVRQQLLTTGVKGKSPVGLWTDGQSKFGIIKNDHPDWDYDYVAVILEASKPEKIGELKMGFNEKNGRFEGTYFSNSYIPRYTAVFPQKGGSLLGIWGGLLWGRIPIQGEVSFDQPLYDPSQPSLEQLDEQTVLLSIPSFLIEKKELDQLLRNHHKNLATARYLIIDIRGNSGGNGIYFDLISWYANQPIKSEPGWALSSKDNMDYFERFANNKKNNPYFPVVEDMKNSVGEMVKGPRFSTIKLKQQSSKLEKVVILTNEDNKSAAETFILHSKKASDKVITIGQNTAGVVDYNNINMIPISCEKLGVYFGYPMYTLHQDIPKNGYNETGIAPDVRSDKTGRELITFTLKNLPKW